MNRAADAAGLSGGRREGAEIFATLRRGPTGGVRTGWGGNERYCHEHRCWLRHFSMRVELPLKKDDRKIVFIWWFLPDVRIIYLPVFLYYYPEAASRRKDGTASFAPV